MEFFIAPLAVSFGYLLGCVVMEQFLRWGRRKQPACLWCGEKVHRHHAIVNGRDFCDYNCAAALYPSEPEPWESPRSE